MTEPLKAETPGNDLAEVKVLPALSLRVGITGARAISPQQTEFIRTEVDIILRLIREEVGQLAKDPRASRLYAHDTPDTVAVNLRIVSALAEGADCLVAEEAIKLGYSLYAPIPFPIHDYEKDFDAGLETFQSLVKQGHLVELDGDRALHAPESYEAVGHFVAANCDLLIAIWDGKPARGRGGTAEIVDFAASADLPVWWIDLEKNTARFIANSRDWSSIQDPSDRGSIDNGAQATGVIYDYLAKIILPPNAGFPPRTGIFGYAIHHACKFCNHNPQPLQVYKEERIPPSDKGLWQTYSWLFKMIAPPAEPLPPPMEAQTPVEKFWDGHYRRADRLSIAYANRYRSSYVLIIFAALAAYLVANVGRYVLPKIVMMTLPLLPLGAQMALCDYSLPELIQTALELLALLLAAGLVFQNHLRGWQDRWIDYRLLAELCRKQIILSPLGRTLPGVEMNDMAQEDTVDSDLELPRALWVSRYFSALVRDAPYPETDLQTDKQRAFALGCSLVNEQSQYHRQREIRTKDTDDRLVDAGDAFFLATVGGLIVAGGCLLYPGHLDPLEWIEVSALLFSGISAALVAIRAYAEFALISRQSQRMRRIMNEISRELKALDLARPLSSVTLGATLQGLSLSMMQEVGGWAEIFRLKSVESH